MILTKLDISAHGMKILVKMPCQKNKFKTTSSIIVLMQIIVNGI
jgi:hypothetical protein